jgi:hypothetical protein
VKIGLDIDGVFANFNRAFYRLCTGCEPPWTSDPHSWDWTKHLDVGEVIKGWQKAGNSTWWQSAIDTYPTITDKLLTQLKCLDNDHDVYFVSSRPAIKYMRYCTEDWISNFLRIDRPMVLLAAGPAQKANVALGLQLDAFLDDNGDNCAHIATRTSRSCLVGLLDKPYNKEFQYDGVQRFASVHDFLVKINSTWADANKPACFAAEQFELR